MTAAITEKSERGGSIAAKKAMVSQLEGASDDEGEDSASDASDDEGRGPAGPASLIYSASDDEGDDAVSDDEGEDAASDSGGSGKGFLDTRGCS